jgi:hypothetical protein
MFSVRTPHAGVWFFSGPVILHDPAFCRNKILNGVDRADGDLAGVDLLLNIVRQAE